MKKKSVRPEDIEVIEEAAQRGADVSGYFTGEFQAKQRVNVDFPLPLLKTIDAECRAIGVTRQAWIKMACDERLRDIRASRAKTRAS